MRLQVIASLGIIHSILHACLAVSLVDRQGGSMITATPPVLTPTLEDKPASPTPTLANQPPSPADPAPPVIGVPVPEPPKDGVYPIPLIASEDDEWDYPVVQVRIGVTKAPINLAVSIYSNETWLLHSSKGVCVQEKECTVLEPDRLVEENGIQKVWNYTGENGLVVSGNLYKFTSFEPLYETGVKWGLKDFTVGVAWTEAGIEGLGKVDGVLGLGPGSTFLQELTNTSEKALSLYLGKDNGTLVIGGYLPKQASGNFTDVTTGEDGVVRLRVQNLTIKGDTTEILKNVTATIDPGLPDIVIPKSVQEYLTKNEKTKWTMVGNSLQFGADGPKEGNRPSFVFDFGDGVHVEMGEEQYTLANEPAFRVGADDQIILGRSFLRSAYIVMDNTHTTYHLAQANIGNTDIENPTAITVFNRQGEANPPHNDDVDTNPDDTNTNDSSTDNNGDKTSSPSGTEKSTPGKNNTGIIVGGIVAGVVALAVIFGFILYWHRRSQRQVNEIEGYMGSPKRLSEGSEFNAPPAAPHRSVSPPHFTQENTHLMEGYPIQQHPLGSRESIFREEMNTSSPTPLPPTMQYHYEDDDHPNGMHGPTSRRSPRRDQDLVRTESVVSTTDVDLSAMDRSARNVPRLPMYNTRPEDTAL